MTKYTLMKAAEGVEAKEPQTYLTVCGCNAIPCIEECMRDKDAS